MTEHTDVLVIGGGITGLATADRVATLRGPAAVRLLEADARLGGKILTERVDGFVLEGGPDCFLAMKPGGMALSRHLGLEDRLRGTDPRFRRSFVKRGGRLHELPDGITGLVPSRIGPLMTTRLLSVRGRARAALELLAPPRRDDGDESIASFASRRFGREAYDWLIEPLLGGIFAGDGEQLSLAATFPQLRDAERTGGAILRLMLRRRFHPAAPGGARPPGFVTPEGGLGEFVEALRARLEGRCTTGARVAALSRERGAWRAILADGRSFTAGSVVLAVPAFAAAALLEGTDPALASVLRGIPFASTATVSVAFPRAAVPAPFDGYGYVAPRAEGGDVVACTWTSNKFPSRVPADGVLLRFFVGRSGGADVMAMDDGALRALVRRELEAVHGITAEPSLTWICRWPAGMPQYTLGHRERRERIALRAAALPGLALAGASYDGVGIPDCIASGWAAADRVTGRAAEAA